MVYGIWYLVYGRKSQHKGLGLFVLISFVLSVLLMLKISLPVWEGLPFLSLVQFPLRFSALAVFAASIAAGLLVKYLPFKKLLALSLLLLIIYANRNHWHINEVFDPGENYYLSLKTTSASFDEHLPKWGRKMSEVSSSKYLVLRGQGKVQITEDKSHRVTAQVVAETPLTLRFNQFYFPGWEIKADGKKVNFDYLTGGENYGLPVFDLEAGKHQIKAEFRNTSDRNIADFISLISVILWIVLLCRLLIRV